MAQPDPTTPRNSPARPPASIQLDMDGLWAVLDHLGHRQALEEDPLYERAFPRFLELFDRFHIRATLFVVGRDLDVPWKVRLLEEAAARGHEIASHGMSHSALFGRLAETDLYKEVVAAAAKLENELGRRPVGFRAPGFLVAASLLSVLEQEGYLYDASLLPTFVAPVLRRARSLLARRPVHAFGQGCSPQAGLAPAGPYHPSRVNPCRRGGMKLWEVPVTTFPFVRLPFHASYLLAASRFLPAMNLYRLGLGILKRKGAPVHYLFHLADLADPMHDRRLRGHPGFDLPVSHKESFCSRLVEALVSGFRVLPVVEHVRALT